jgi:hypothetical protein
MSVTPHDGAGTSLTFASANYTVTNIVYSLGQQDNQQDAIDVSHLGQTTGQAITTISRPLSGTTAAGGTTGREVTVEYLGKSIIADGATGTLTITHSGTTFLSAVATVASSSVTFALNDAIRGSATFRVAR